MAKRHYERPVILVVEIRHKTRLLAASASGGGDMDVIYDEEDI